MGLGLQILMRILTAVRMTLLARYQGLALSFPQMLTILYTASFYSLLLPGALMGAQRLMSNTGSMAERPGDLWVMLWSIKGSRFSRCSAWQRWRGVTCRVVLSC